MAGKHSQPSNLTSKPSSSFSASSAASATSAATSRSGGSKLLFGEIDTSSDRSSESYASVCSFVICDSGTFLKFWLDDTCRDNLLSYVTKKDLASLRLACHDFSVRAAPALFQDLSITFRANTFTKPARLAALDRLGFHVKTLTVNLPHTADTFLPPLVDPETGSELSYTYTPQIQPPSPKRPKYGDIGTTEILTRQYPPLFHAATNVSAFVRAFSAFINLAHLKISTPQYDTSAKQRRSVVDFALISLRIAVERNCLNALDTLTLSPIHPGGLLYLSPLIGYGATPASASRWSRIRHLTIHSHTLATSSTSGEPHHFKLLQTYLRNFQSRLTSFNFCWIGGKSPFPIQRPVTSDTITTGEHPAHAQRTEGGLHPASRRKGPRPLHFPRMKHFQAVNVSTTAADISAFVAGHKRTLEDLNLEDFHLTSGTWDEALAPLAALARPEPSREMADIPIMLSPSTMVPLPAPMQRVEAVHEDAGKRSLSKWLSSSRSRNPAAARKVRESLLGCEEQLRKVLKGGILPWK